MPGTRNDIAHDPAHPFLLTVGAVDVVARGTRFDVSRDGNAVQVTLLEGVVTVATRTAVGRPAASVTLRPGEAVLVTPDEGSLRVTGDGEIFIAVPGH